MVSADGQKVAFVSTAKLTATDNSGRAQLYVRDLSAGTTSLASSTQAGAAANEMVEAGSAANPYFDISADGRYVVFGTGADNLVPGDSNGKQDVFLKDMQSGKVQAISVMPDCRSAPACVTRLGNGDSRDPSIDALGNFVAFTTDANDLITGDSNGASDVVRASRLSGGFTSPIRPSGGPQPNGPTLNPSISGDGSTIAYEAAPQTTNLGSDTPGRSDVYVDSFAARTLLPIHVASATNPDVSGNGRFIAFLTDDALASGDSNGVTDAYVRDLREAAPKLISVRSGRDTSGDGPTNAVALSADAQRAVFASSATDLVDGDTNGQTDVFSRRLNGNDVIRLEAGGWPAIAGNGGRVALSSAAPVIAEDTNGVADVYLRDLGATDTTGPVPTRVVYECGYKGSGGYAITWDEPSGVAYSTVQGHPGPAGIGTVWATDGAGNKSETEVTIEDVSQSNCGYEYDHDPQDPIRSIKIVSIKRVKQGVKVSYTVKRGSHGERARVNFRTQKLRLNARGKTLGRRFTGPARTKSVGHGSGSITLPMSANKGTYRLRVLVPQGPNTHPKLILKRFTIR